MEQSNSRASRNTDTRALAQRPTRWAPSQLLPDINPEEGYALRWIRLSTLNADDPINISAKLREGWEPVKASDHPEAYVSSSPDTRFPDSVQVGGLMLCKIPQEFMVQRDEHYQTQSNAQMQSVDNNFMRESDPRMPVFNERRTKVTFGKGN
jgi:hypothetical protein